MATNSERFTMAEVGSGEELVAGMLECTSYYGDTQDERIAHVDKMIAWINQALVRLDYFLVRAFATEMVGAALLAGFSIHRYERSLNRRNRVIVKGNSIFMEQRLFHEFRDAVLERAGEQGIADKRPS